MWVRGGSHLCPPAHFSSYFPIPAFAPDKVGDDGMSESINEAMPIPCLGTIRGV